MQKTFEECQQAALAAGALEPQNWQERAAAGVMSYQQGRRWADTPLARARLAAWTEDCMLGRPFRQVR